MNLPILSIKTSFWSHYSMNFLNPRDFSCCYSLLGRRALMSSSARPHSNNERALLCVGTKRLSVELSTPKMKSVIKMELILLAIFVDFAYGANVACQEMRYKYQAKGMDIYDVPLKPQSGKKHKSIWGTLSWRESSASITFLTFEWFKDHFLCLYIIEITTFWMV